MHIILILPTNTKTRSILHFPSILIKHNHSTIEKVTILIRLQVVIL